MMSTEKEEQIPLIQKDIPESSGFTWYLGLAAIICVVGSSFQVGYNNALTNSPQEVLKLFINESYQTNYNETISEELLTTFWAITSSAIGIGGMIGSLIAGPIINHYGSKTTLVYNNVLVLIGSALSGFAKMVGRFELMIVGRFIAGINGGMNSTIVPVYLTEISPISTRGYIGSGHQIGIGIGIAIAVVLGLKQIFGTEELFPLMFAFSALLAVFQLCSLPFCPESPRFLMLTRKDQEAAGKCTVLTIYYFILFESAAEIYWSLLCAIGIRNPNMVQRAENVLPKNIPGHGLKSLL